MDVLIGSAVAILVISVAIYTRLKEKRLFNNGICLKCSSKLDCFHNDFSMRGYICDKCYYTVWVSFGVDNKHARSSVD